MAVGRRAVAAECTRADKHGARDAPRSMQVEKARQVCENYYLNPGVASSYLIGKFEILKVKQYFKEKLEGNFSLNRFNREVIGYGSMPVSLIKRLMLNKHYVDEKVIN